MIPEFAKRALAATIEPYLTLLQGVEKRVKSHGRRLNELNKRTKDLEESARDIQEGIHDLLARAEEVIVAGTEATGEHLDFPDSGD